MTQATNTTPSDLIVQHKGVWKVYTKSSFIDEWVVNEQLFVVNVSQTLGRNTGTATLKYLAQDETLQNNLKIAGWEHHNLSMTGTTMPQTTLVKIQNESQPPAEGALIAEPEIIFIGIILSMTLDFSRDLVAQDLTAIDVAGMLNNYDFFGKRSYDTTGVATIFYDMLPVFNPGNKGNRSESKVNDAYIIDEANIEVSDNTRKWNSDDVLDYLLWWMNNSEYVSGQKDYEIFTQLFKTYDIGTQTYVNQSTLNGDTAETTSAFLGAVYSDPIIGGGINNWVPYNKGVWNALTDLVELVGQFTTRLKYGLDNDGNSIVEIVIVERA